MMTNIGWEMMVSIKGEDSSQMRTGLERRKVLWDHLEEVRKNYYLPTSAVVLLSLPVSMI
jgi:hypothetical protein